VEGDIECKNAITTSGKIFGNIKCESAEIENAQVEGNISVENKLLIKANSVITGDLSGKHIEISGIIKGNINADQYIKMCSDAKVTGDIAASALSIDSGASLQGNVSVLTK
jgi:cytoskeletal protein CcmA (bactofilin family)